jgi:hypothetical protein
MGSEENSLQSLRENSVLVHVAPAFRRASWIQAHARLKAGATKSFEI